MALAILTSVTVQAVDKDSVEFTKKIEGVLDSVSKCTQSIKKSIAKNPQAAKKIDETVDYIATTAKKVVQILEVTPEKEAALKETFNNCKENVVTVYEQSIKPHVAQLVENVSEILFSDKQKNENIKTVLNEATDKVKAVLSDEKVKQVAKKIGESLKAAGDGVEKVVQEK